MHMGHHGTKSDIDVIWYLYFGASVQSKSSLVQGPQPKDPNKDRRQAMVTDAPIWDSWDLMVTESKQLKATGMQKYEKVIVGIDK